MNIKAVLFDLDGTLLDTAPDLTFALNQLRRNRNLPELPLEIMRPIASLGSKAMLKFAFEIEENHPEFNNLREQFLALYQQHLVDSTTFFPHMEQVLNYLDRRKIPWGIVTNKLTRHTLGILKGLGIAQKPACVVCGDSLPHFKPHPEPILFACKLLKQQPENCIYVGDTMTDVTASKAAGTKSLVVLYGYTHSDTNPFVWEADGYVEKPIEIIDWLAKYL